jgi:hypothetical protein
MSERRDDLLDEAVLRRALRLDEDERAPRFDVGAIALAARRPAFARHTAVGALAAAAVLGVAAVSIWSAIFAIVPTVGDALIATAIDAAVSGATLLAPIAELAAQPAVPLSLLAALGVAILHEVRDRREHQHANAS